MGVGLRFREVRPLIVLALLLQAAISPALAYDWLQFGGNAQHSGNNAAETILNPGNVGSLVQKYQATLPGNADGAPVFLESVNTPGGVRNLLFVTTHDGWIVALDAQTGGIVWNHQNGPGTCVIVNGGGAPCYTTSSPAIDPNRAYVYSYGLDGYVHKYQVGDGTEIVAGGWPQLTTLKGFDEKASSALSFATSAGNTYLYVTHGGYPGDNGDYQGHVTAINLATGAQKVFNAACSDQPAHFYHLGGGTAPTCTTRQNAIWSRPGVIYDAGTNRIFMGTGNAFTSGAGQYDGNHNWSESVIALNPDGSGGSGANAGKPLDSYTPTNHVSLDSADADVGSTAPAILPVPPSSKIQHLAVQGGKDQTLRLLNLQDLSGQGNPGNVGGEVSAIVNVPQGGVVLSQPAVWVNPNDGSTWIFVVNCCGASALRLNFDGSGNPSLPTVPQWQSVQSGTSPVVAGNMVFYLGGNSVRAVDAVSGNLLWSAARGSTHWQSLIVANGVVYATDQSNHLAAFGLPQNPGWVEDAVPAGAAVVGNGGDNWNWVSSNPSPYSGALAHQSAIATGFHQHYFQGASATLAVDVGDTLFAYVYLDPANLPSELMLQWNDGSWEHRAYWGSNVIPFGADGTASRRYMGPLPPAAQWVRLAVPAAQVGLEGRTLNGMAFSLYGGRATWDYAWKTMAWVQDAVPAGAALWNDGGDSWSWVTSNPAPYSGATAHQSALVSGFHQHYFTGASTLPVSVGDTLSNYVYLDAVNPPTELMLQWNDGSWEHRAYWGANVIPFGTDGTTSRRYMGPLPANGQWVRLGVPAADVGLEGRALNGMAFSLYGGRATWDYASTSSAWVQDAVPAGAALWADGGDTWNWVASNPTPFSGTYAHQSALAAGYHQHYFALATDTLAVAAGDTLFTYVFLDPANPPSEVMLQWNDGGWEHRAYWGANLIALGIDGTASRRFMGPLPAVGQWVRLAVPAAQVGLEGRTLNGMAFTLWNGRATWDYTGK
jgi:hypothetical protein